MIGWSYFVLFFCESVAFGVECLAILIVLFKFRLRIGTIDILMLAVAANNLILVAGCVSLLYYPVAFVLTWYSGVEYEQYAILTRTTGKYWFVYDITYMVYGLLPQLIWFKRVRHNPLTFVYWAIIIFTRNLFIHISSSVWPYFDFIYQLKSMVMFTIALAITHSTLIYRTPDIKFKTSF